MTLPNNTSTSISNVQNPTSSAKGTTQTMQWSEEQVEILKHCLEEQVANEAYYLSLDEPHRVSCNCMEYCN